MVLIAIVVGCLVGALIGIYAPIIPYTYSGYLAIANSRIRFCFWRN